MGKIQSNIGLITGIPITDTINQLMQIEAQPRELVKSRSTVLQAKKDAITDLTAKVLAFQFYAKKLTSADLFRQQSVTSSDTSALSVRFTTGEPVEGEYQFKPIQVAQKQQLLTSTFASDTQALGAGTLTLRYGNSIDQGVDVGTLNGGRGISRGKIRITDRSGASAEVDLSAARTVDDVINAVNKTTGINVTLVADGDRFKLIDNTGQTTANLKVQEVSGGSTAADLGLAGINVASDSAIGNGIFKLYNGLSLSSLNDGLGVRFLDELPDLKVNFQDGSTPLEIDFNRPTKNATQAKGTSTGLQGDSSKLLFTAKSAGDDLDGLKISFVNDDNVTAGNETVDYDRQAKTLVVHIDEGQTNADNIINAIANHPLAKQDLTVTKSSGQLFAKGTTTPANGATAELKVQAKSAGSAYDGFTVSFVDDPAITKGNETVVYNANAKTIVFHIKEGASTATDLVAAAATNPTFNAAFSVSTPSHFATTTTTAVNGADAQVKFTSISSNANFNNVSIVYQDNPSIAKGQETVAYTGGPPGGTLTFQINAGETTADDIVAAVSKDAAVKAKFTAIVPDGSTGDGLVDVADTGTTAGGGNLGLISTADSIVTAGGAAGLIDVNDRAFVSGGAAAVAKDELTLGDVLTTINEQSQGRLKAEISSDGQRIQITDLTDDLGGSFSLSSLYGSKALADLGLSTTPSGDTLTGTRLHSGLKSTLLRSLDGGKGLTLGTLNITDRAGQSVSVDLSSAITLDDVIGKINSAAKTAGVAIEVGVNASHQGLTLTDNSGSTAGNLIIATGDASQTAEKLGLAVNAAVTTKNGGDLHRQSVTENTKLSSLNGGRGVAAGKFQIFNSKGVGLTITVSSDPNGTIGDLINSINGPAFGVEARLNDAGDGIELIDRAGGSSRLKVAANGADTTANDLRLLTSSTDETIDNVGVQVLRGSSNYTVTLDSDDTLDDLISKYNALGSGSTAVKLGNGTVGNPFRISLFSDRTGTQSNLTFNTSGVNFNVQETVHGQDALLSFGGGEGILSSSATNTFTDIVPGVEVTVKAATGNPVTVNITATNGDLSKALTDMTTSYNTLRDTYAKYTAFNETDQTAAILFGTAEALRLDSDLSNVLTSRFAGNGKVQSFSSLGITLNGDGKMVFDSTKLQDAFDSDPSSIEEFFTKENRGAGFKLDDAIESLVGVDNSLLVNSARTLTQRIDSNTERIAFFDDRLAKKREALEKTFYNLELAIGKLKNNQSALDQIQYIPPLGSSSG